MSRPLAGYIGYDGEPTTTAAPGIWTLREAELYQRKAQWPAPTPDLVPSDITGLQLWLDASDASTLYDATTGGSLVAADGGVARWEDKSGNGNHATQGTSGNRPLRKASVQNGLDGLRFDGSDDFLSVQSSTATFKFLHSSAHTMFWVVSPRALNTRETLFETGLLGSPSGDSGSLGASLLFFSNGVIAHRVQAGPDPEVVNNTAASTVAANSFYVISVVANPASGTASLRSSTRVNGGSAVTNNTQTESVSTSNSRIDFTVGRIVGYAGNGSVDFTEYADLDFCEIAIYNSALSDTDREAVENYLIEKWGIT